MQWIPVIFARNSSLISKLIRLFSRHHQQENHFSHVGVLEGDLVLESVGGVGCKATKLSEFISRYDHYEFGYIPVVSKRKAYNFYWGNVNKKTPYDKYRSWGYILRKLGLGKVKDFEHTDKLDCAEFIQGGMGWLDKIDDISPNYLAAISEKKPLVS